MRKMVICSCKQCGNNFSCRESFVKRGYGFFCSKECRNNSFSTKLTKSCGFCSKPVNVRPSQLKKSKSGLVFCNRLCKEKAQRLENKIIVVSNYKNGLSQYRTLAFRLHKNQCNRCGYNKHLEILDVHHKDRDRNNNSIDNLEILCPNCHALEHRIKAIP